MQSIGTRYQNDPVFRQLVDLLYSQLDAAQFTPSEVREAAMFAQILYEERHIRPIIYDTVRGDFIREKR